ncbi:hypothetical protein [Rhodococcus tukisamuensis]|uniref:Signal peptidase I n=1 Tax=Rhodococcus tukisamuensis TaxID=168276 RepID=A0A1G6SDP9_9NOCA|nr:hypothetical protein [Rhodococcus tukisamuensis]SDD14784.1 signal peptidase I [Rhodococcus tukisamuensis]
MTTHQSSPDSSRSRGREIALNVGAIAGLICVLAAAASFLFGIKPLVFRSGSMSPEIPTGALALSKATAAGDLAVGDVVSVLDQQGTRITHRIHEIVSADGINSVLILKGDANKDADISPYTVTEVDRVFFSVPGLGYAVSWLSSPMAIFLGGALVGSVMVLAFGPVSKRKDDNDSDDSGTGGGPGTHERTEQPVAAAIDDAPTQQFRAPNFQLRRLLSPRTAIALGAVGLTVLGAGVTGTSAAFSDSATANSGTFAAAADLLPRPVEVICDNNGNSVQTRVKHLGYGFNYRLVVKRGDQVVVKDVIKVSGTEAVGSWLYFPQLTTGDTGGHTAWTYYARVYTVNPASGQESTGWQGHEVYQPVTWDLNCSSGINGLMAESGNSGTGGTDTARMRSLPAPEAGEGTIPTSSVVATSSTPGSATSSTLPTTTSSVAPTATTTAPSSSTAPSATRVPPTTTTVPPVTTTEEKTEAPAVVPVGEASPSGTYAAAVDGTTATITDSSGTEVFTGTVGKGTKTQWAKGSDELWIVDGDKVSVVDATTGKQKIVDPTSDTVPAEVAALVAK